jgi:starch synthase
MVIPHKAMKILFAASEVVPFAKTGGLADVAGALPKALARRGCEIAVMLPKYRQVDVDRFQLKKIKEGMLVPMGSKMVPGGLWKTELEEKVTVYFVEQNDYFDRDGLYVDSNNKDYPDNAERFGFFSRAVLEASKILGFKPDIVHAHDWQTALIPVYLKTLYKQDPWFDKTRTVFTIHNLGYQGIFNKYEIVKIGLGWELFHHEKLEFYGDLNLLKGGIIYADVLNTVSRKYAEEIQTPEFGHRLDGLLRTRKKDLYGILNGIDYEEWHPSIDKFIAANYHVDDLSGKAICKSDLQREYKLPIRSEVALIGMITRLVEQKGIDLVADVLDKMMELDLQLVLLGTGDKWAHEFFQAAQVRYPQKIGVALRYDNVLAHKIEAGADMFLMPSRYEPCGLNQMYSLAYGTVPIVRATGGLDDTVENFNPTTGQGTGFKFLRPTPEELLNAIYPAILNFYTNKTGWIRLMRNGMLKNFSWDVSAGEYIKLYERALEK